MLIISIIALISVELMVWRKYRDLKSPAVMFGFLWILSLINLSTMGLSTSIDETALIIIIVGTIVFQIGYYVGTHIKINKTEYTIMPNNAAIKGLIIALFVFALPVIIQYFSFINSYGGSIYNAIIRAETSLSLPALFDYYRKLTQYIFFAFLVLYWKEPIEKQKSLRPYVLILAVIATLSAFSVPTRNSILFFVLPLLMCWLCTHKTSNLSMAKALLLTVFVFVLVFYFISLGKYWYQYNNTGTSRFAVVFDEFQIYLSGSVAAFSTTWKYHSFSRLGSNTFRFFIVIIDSLFGTHNAVPLINEFTTLSNGLQTNVYTFYDFYLRDFGVSYALFIQFVVAIIHGLSYRKMLTGSPYSIYLFSLLSYPLVMQFFQDQYFSLLSTWIQITIVGFFVFKSNIFFKRV